VSTGIQLQQAGNTKGDRGQHDKIGQQCTAKPATILERDGNVADREHQTDAKHGRDDECENQ
jgi:hypothetical protein